MTATLDSALHAALSSTLPRPGFAESLLATLKEASRSPMGMVEPVETDGHGRWLFAGTVAAGAVGAASVAVYGVRRRLRRGAA
jgi:hypothetical protein